MSVTTAEDTASSASTSGDGGERVEERFRVDRRKLESLMAPLSPEDSSPADGPRPLDQFFADIERRTGAQIAWPSRLKVGAKSKRDPQVKVSGNPASVQLAKALILSHCSRKYSKLTLRIDVPHTEHGQLIGRQGALQKEIKSRTGTDIHFPDSNKSAADAAAATAASVGPVGGGAGGKSNQVSLNGLAGPQPAGMEAARCLIRAKQPVQLILQLPPCCPVAPDPAGHAFVRQICAAFDVTVGRHHHGGVGDDADLLAAWTVRGLAENAEGLARAVECLAYYCCVSLLMPPPLTVRCRLDFERRHAAAVRERMLADLPAALTSPAAPEFFRAAVVKQFGVRRFEFADTGVSMWELNGCRQLLRLRQFVLSCLPAYLCFDMPCNSFALEDTMVDSLKGRTVDGVTLEFAMRRGGGGGAGGGGGNGGGSGVRAVTLRTHEGNAQAMYKLLASLFGTPVPPEPPAPQPAAVTQQQLQQQLMMPPHVAPQPPPPPPPPPPSSPPQPQQPLSQDSLAPGAEYSRKRLAALRVMSHKPSGDRFPTDQWSGLGFSRSWATPGPTASAGSSAACPEVPEAVAPVRPQSPQQPQPPHQHQHHQSSGIQEAPPPFAQSCHHQQLRLSVQTSTSGVAPGGAGSGTGSTGDSTDALLRLLGDNKLADCAQVMVANEIDLQTFVTLSDDDLKAMRLPYTTREKIRRLIQSMASGPLV